MADFLKEFKFKMSFDKKDIKRNLNEISADVKDMLSEMGKASDKMPVFKQMAEYLESIGTALREIGAADKGVFNQLFAGVDENLVNQMERIFSLSLSDAKSIKNMFGQLSQIKSGDLKPTTQMLRGMAESLSDLYKVAGMKADIDLDFFVGKVGKKDTEKRIQVISNALLNLSNVIGNVNDKLTGFGDGSGGFGAGISDDIDNENKAIQKKIDELEAQKKRYQEIIDVFSGKKVGVSINKKNSASVLEKTLNEFKEVTNTLNSDEFRSTASAEERTRLMAEQLRLAMRLESIDGQLGDKGSNKAIDLSIGARKTMDKALEIAKGAKNNDQVKAIFEQDIRSINSQISELKTPAAVVADTIENIESPFGKMVSEAEQLQNLVFQLEKLFDNINSLSDTIEYKVLINGQEIDILQGGNKEVSEQTMMEAYLGTLGKKRYVSAHNHPGGRTSKTDSADFSSIIDDIYSGVTAMGMTIGENDITTLDFSKVKIEDALEVLAQIEELEDKGQMSVSAKEINSMFQAINPEYNNVAKLWKPSELKELAKYVYEIGENANIAVEPLTQFQNILQLATNGKIDLDKYKDLLDNFDVKNASSVFNKIMESEGRKLRVDNVEVSSLSEFADTVRQHQKMLPQQRVESGITYSEIYEIVKSYIDSVNAGETSESETQKKIRDFLRSNFTKNEQSSINNLLYSLEDGGLKTHHVANSIAGYFGINSDDFITDETIAIEQAKTTLEEFRELKRDIFANVDYSTDDVTIGEYTGKLKAAYDELTRLAEQGLITADSLAEVDTIFSDSKSYLGGKVKDYTDYYSGGSYDYNYEDEYIEARDRAQELEYENEALKEELSRKKGANTGGSADSEGVEQSDINAEIQYVEQLRDTILMVEQAIQAKTQAFMDEGVIVEQTVEREIKALKELLLALGYIKSAINDINEGFGISNALPAGSEGAEANGFAQNLIENKYALDSTLLTTNGILQSILDKISTNVSSEQLVAPLNDVVIELRNVASGISQQGNSGSGSEDNVPKEKETKKQDKFTQALKNQKSEFKDFAASLEKVEYLSDELRASLSALGIELEQVADGHELDKWQKSFQSVVDNVAIEKGTFESINDKNIKEFRGKLNSELKTLDFTATTLNTTEAQKEILTLRKQLIQQLEEYELNVKNGKETELSSINATLSALRNKISAYKEANDLVNTTSQGGSKFGSTATLNATAKFKSLQQKAFSDEFSASSTVQDAFKQYKVAYDALIAKRKELSSLDIVPDKERAIFKQLQTDCNNYGKALDKLITESQKLAQGSVAHGFLGGDFDDSDQGRRSALQDFVDEIYGANAVIDKFTEGNNKLLFTVNNGDGTFSRMAAEINKARNAMDVTVVTTEKVVGKFESLWNMFKGKLKSIGTYLAASFGFQEIWQQIRKGVEYVREIDKALTELKKVTDETDASYNRFLQDMSKTGSIIGATISDLTNMAAEWARLNI